MRTREIPRREWTDFCEGFSRRHDGWLATVEVLDPQMGAQIAARQQPLRGITAEEDAISIFLGEEPEGRVTRVIRAPSRLWLEETPEGAEWALAIEEPGGKIILRFDSSFPPEMVDGLAP